MTTLPRPGAQIAQAVEAAETGTAPLGENPALLRNASGTPASFSRGLLIGATALDSSSGVVSAASSASTASRLCVVTKSWTSSSRQTRTSQG